MYGVWCMVGVWWVYGVWWITTAVIIRPSQPSLAGVGAGAELGNTIIIRLHKDPVAYCIIWYSLSISSVDSNYSFILALSCSPTTSRKGNIGNLKNLKFL